MADRNDDQGAMDDDLMTGRLLSRREVLIVTGGVTVAAFVAACSANGAASTSSALSTSALPPGASTSAGPSAAAGATNAASASVAPSVVPTCVAAPALTEGPYFVEEKLNRSDIRANADGSDTREGATLALTFVIYQLTSSGCTAWSGAVVDVWHCDAAGAYSDVN